MRFRVIKRAIAVLFDVHIHEAVLKDVELVVDMIFSFRNERVDGCERLFVAAVRFDRAEVIVVFVTILARCAFNEENRVGCIIPNDVFDVFDERAFNRTLALIGGLVVHAGEVDITDSVVYEVEHSALGEHILCRTRADSADKLRHRTVGFGAHKVGVDG